jgi:hypothetical protein
MAVPGSPFCLLALLVLANVISSSPATAGHHHRHQVVVAAHHLPVHHHVMIPVDIFAQAPPVKAFTQALPAPPRAPAADEVIPLPRPRPFAAVWADRVTAVVGGGW